MMAILLYSTMILIIKRIVLCYSSLQAIRTLQKFGHLPSDASVFRSYAHHGVFQDIRVVAIEALVDFIKSKHHTCNTVNTEIFARILFSRIAFKDIFATLKICDKVMIYLHQ